MATTLVRDLMHIGVPTCPENMPALEAVRTLLCDGLEALVVMDCNGHAVGIFGRREAVAASTRPGGDWTDLTVADVMRADILEIPPDVPATVAAQIMLDRGVRELYLMHHGPGISWPAAVLRFEDVLSPFDGTRLSKERIDADHRES
jgi:CBS domain-containing protein